MTLIGRSGSLTLTSSQDAAKIETNRVQPDNQLAATSGDVDKLQYITDTFTTLSAVNTERYSDIAGMLVLYPEGSPIVVTYYHRNLSQIDIRSDTTDISPTAHTVHKDYTKIFNFEMRLLGQLESNFEEIDNGFIITGEALIYPGFVPTIGDEFLLDMGDNKVGEFKLTNVTPTTYRQGRCHKVSFEIVGYVDNKVLLSLEKGVRDIFYFDKNVYIGDGDYTFLKSEDYQQLQELKSLHKSLIQYYVNTFYDEAWESFRRPDGLYDPYIVEFLRHRLSLRDAKVRPSQLYSRNLNYHDSIWYLFTDATTENTLNNVVSSARTVYFSAEAFATDHNALINRTFISLVKNSPLVLNNTTITEIPVEFTYLFTNAFYSSDVAAMTPIERMTYEYITTRKLHVPSVLDLSRNYRNMSDMDKFNYIPILIELVTTTISNINNF